MTNIALEAEVKALEDLCQANPDMTELPAGFVISDAFAAQIKCVAEHALVVGYPALRAEGRGAALEYWKAAAEEFASCTLMLSADRESYYLSIAARRGKSHWSRLWTWWRGALANAGESNLLTDEEATDLKKSAAEILGEEGISLMEQHLSRLESSDYARRVAEYMVLATLRLAQDREARIGTGMRADSVVPLSKRPSFYDGLRPKSMLYPESERGPHE